MEEKKIEYDLFGSVVERDVLLRDKFIEPPFTVLDSKSGNWQRRKKRWKELGMKSEIGREADGNNSFNKLSLRSQGSAESVKKIMSVGTTASIFDPALAELMYHWFCPEKGTILDPFAGGSVRGIVANYLGYKYTGIELRQEQVDSNREQGKEILPNNQPLWICGDSDSELEKLDTQFDFVFSCPPYADLEIYSDLPEDLSNMDYKDFVAKYRSIIDKTVKLMKKGSYAVFVVGEVRDKEGYYYNFIGDTKRAFIDCGAKLYNDMVYLQAIGSASLYANNAYRNKKIAKVHQNVLCFKKI